MIKLIHIFSDKVDFIVMYEYLPSNWKDNQTQISKHEETLKMTNRVYIVVYIKHCWNNYRTCFFLVQLELFHLLPVGSF